jgi:hypothetical protein
VKKKKEELRHECLALPEDLSKRLATYALAAAAAGVGLMGAATPAEASIITYTPSPPFKVIPAANAFSQRFSSRGVPLLSFRDELLPNGFADLSVGLVKGLNDVQIRSTFACGIMPCAARLSPGQPVGKRWNGFSLFEQPAMIAEHSQIGQRSPYIPWVSNGIGYMGLKFTVGGKSYFGWAKMSVTTSSKGGLDATLYEVGVDTVAGQDINAGQTSAVPEPGTLSLLALGAAGLFALRKRKLSAISRQQSANNWACFGVR